jgi:hypothetical protein
MKAADMPRKKIAIEKAKETEVSFHPVWAAIGLVKTDQA